MNAEHLNTQASKKHSVEVFGDDGKIIIEM